MEHREPKVLWLKDGYHKSRGLEGWYRELTVGEAKRLGYGATLYVVVLDAKGAQCVQECRVNGAPKVWKTKPGCELPLKHGLKRCDRVGAPHLQDHEPIAPYGYHWQIVVPVPGFDKDTPVGIVADWCKEHQR